MNFPQKKPKDNGFQIKIGVSPDVWSPGEVAIEAISIFLMLSTSLVFLCVIVLLNLPLVLYLCLGIPACFLLFVYGHYKTSVLLRRVTLDHHRKKVLENELNKVFEDQEKLRKRKSNG